MSWSSNFSIRLTSHKLHNGCILSHLRHWKSNLVCYVSGNIHFHYTIYMEWMKSHLTFFSLNCFTLKNENGFAAIYVYFTKILILSSFTHQNNWLNPPELYLKCQVIRTMTQWLKHMLFKHMQPIQDSNLTCDISWSCSPLFSPIISCLLTVPINKSG